MGTRTPSAPAAREPSPRSWLIRNATLLTLNVRHDVLHGGLAVIDGRIVAVGPEAERHPGPFARVLDARGGLVLPGFVQTHVHLCQTIFRGFADDLVLLEWLRRRVWPLEAAHTPASLRASTLLASAELLRSGTTSVLTMETVHDTDVVLETLAATGLRATVGKCMMDASTSDVPRRLHEASKQSLDESLALHRRWNGAADGRLRVALAPRFAVSCSRGLLEATAAAAAEANVLVHTHASESRDEVALVRRQTGLDNIAYLAATGLATARLCVAHCVWVDEAEQQLVAERNVKVLHCPGSNLKLASGIAPIVELRARGVSVSLGADGAACNNRLDMYDEMRLAATLQAVRVGPGRLTARDAVWMATHEGARALGLDHEIGSLEPGKRADVQLVDTAGPHLAPGPDPFSTIVYAARGTDVRTVWIDGVLRVDEGALVHLDAAEITARAREEAGGLVARARL
jgi:5-methylthioadenosine/S-adenosylhomocysteine deaminase